MFKPKFMCFGVWTKMFIYMQSPITDICLLEVLIKQNALTVKIIVAVKYNILRSQLFRHICDIYCD